jgi:acetyl esterase/lipase
VTKYFQEIAMRFAAVATLFAFTFSPAITQPKGAAKLTEAKIATADHVYKKTPQGELTLHGYLPPDWKATDKRPAIVFFFGGGWKNGSHTQFTPQAEYFASRGMVAFSADYRIESKHKTTPDCCVEDAKSAVRWMKANAAKLGIDPEKIVASGGSAGAHIAACTATVNGFDASADPKQSSVPAALLLYNPALNLTSRVIKGAKGDDVAGKISPTRHLDSSCPPTWITFGSDDPMHTQGIEFAAKARGLGVPVTLLIAPKQPHGFFNRDPWLPSTTAAADAWLVERGFLTGKCTIVPPHTAKLESK